MRLYRRLHRSWVRLIVDIKRQRQYEGLQRRLKTA